MSHEFRDRRLPRGKWMSAAPRVGAFPGPALVILALLFAALSGCAKDASSTSVSDARGRMMRRAAIAVLLRHPFGMSAHARCDALATEYRKSALVDTAYAAGAHTVYVKWKGEDVPYDVELGR
jgi:hypothetical protein